jgi:hypothetical protein
MKMKGSNNRKIETLECPRVVLVNEDAKLRDQHEVGTSGSGGMRGDKIPRRSLDAQGERSCEMSGIGRSTREDVSSTIQMHFVAHMHAFLSQNRSKTSRSTIKRLKEIEGKMV